MRFVSLCLIYCALPFTVILQEEGTDLDFITTVTSKGYVVETHKVETQDGYILTVFRIPHGKKSILTNNEPVLLHHGLYGSAENFVLLDPGKSLGYVLADNGYDVWLMNARGTSHSRRHKTLKPVQKEFWDFTFHEIGVYDIPAVIDYVLNITNKTELSYIGHSQGCVTVFVTGSERPEYNTKIKIMIGLAPPGIFKHIKFEPLIRVLAPILKVLQDSLKIYELPPSFISIRDIRNTIKLLCSKSGSVLKNLCKSIFMLSTQVSPEIIDMKRIPEMLPLLLDSSSTKQIIHYTQLIKSGNFQQYDWGPEENLRKYGKRNPPRYNYQNITFPAALLYGPNDLIITDMDVKELATELPNVIVVHKVPNKYFGHSDFMWASNPELVLKPVLSLLEKYKSVN